MNVESRLSNRAEESRDFKYVIQDISTVYLGARYTYDELIEADDMPFKIKTLVNRYIKPELSGENLSIESHFYYMLGEGFSYQTFLQLKTKVKFSVLQEKKGFGGKIKKTYAAQTMKLQDFVKIPTNKKEEEGIMIQEISFSKLALMGL